MTAKRSTRRRWLGALGLGAPLVFASTALAVNPLEYPDNGANQFSRGGAWLATATDPIAVHYNPAALSTQPSAMSVDVRVNYNHVCFDRVDLDENGEPRESTGPSREFFPPDGRTQIEYREACNKRQSFPLTIPAFALNWRVNKRLGIGFGIVPPSAYGTANEAWPALAPATLIQRDSESGDVTRREVSAPAPYRYMTLGNQSTILFPTASVGYELFDGFRIGAGFISGIAIINVRTGSISSVRQDQPFDLAQDDSASHVFTQDYFMPGAVLSMHWSANRYLDLALWGRWVDGVRSTDGRLETRTQVYDKIGRNGAIPLTQSNPVCQGDPVMCDTAIPNIFGDEEFERFEFNYPPPEVRLGIRFHMPRSGATAMSATDEGYPVRNPLNDDIWDIELNASYTASSHSDEFTVRFKENEAGQGAAVQPTGRLPPIADRPTGFKDSFGLRLGGQYNVIQDKLGLMAGTWIETESQDPELLNVNPPGPLRGGVGGGIVLRQNFIDFTFGYQYHWSAGLDNEGRGLLRAPAGTADTGFTTFDEPRELPAVDRREFRSFHTINGGSVSQYAHAFAIGSVVRF